MTNTEQRKYAEKLPKNLFALLDELDSLNSGICEARDLIQEYVEARLVVMNTIRGALLDGIQNDKRIVDVAREHHEKERAT